MATSQDPLGSNGYRQRSRHANRVSPNEDLEHRDSREIKSRIDRTRGAMDETLDELGERLNPRNLFDDVVSVFRSPQTRDTAAHAGAAASDFANNLSRQIRDNPIGATLVGAGLAWLTLGNRRGSVEDEYDPIPRRRALQDDYLVGIDDLEQGPHYDAEYYTDEDLLLHEQDRFAEEHSDLVVPESYQNGESEGIMGRATRSTKSAASSASGAVTDAASSAGEAISDSASSLVGGVQSAASSVSEAVSKTSDASRRAYLRSRAAARETARGPSRLRRRASRGMSSATSQTEQQFSALYDSTERRVRRAHQESPLALGLGIMAVGAIAGALIPRPRPEDEWMGETSDEAIGQARRQAQEAYQRGQDAVENTVETAKQSAKAQGLTGDSLAERATRVAEKTASSINEAVKEEGLHPGQLKGDAEAVTEDTKARAKVETEKSQS